MFSRICLVRKLRETSVLAGFTRVLPPEADPKSDRLQPLKSDPRISWLPAAIVRGEGIFFEFDLSKIEERLSDNDRVSAISRLWDAYNQTRATRGQEPKSATLKFVMMHTFAHALINQLTADCDDLDPLARVSAGRRAYTRLWSTTGRRLPVLLMVRNCAFEVYRTTLPG